MMYHREHSGTATTLLGSRWSILVLRNGLSHHPPDATIQLPLFSVLRIFACFAFLLKQLKLQSLFLSVNAHGCKTRLALVHSRNFPLSTHFAPVSTEPSPRPKHTHTQTHTVGLYLVSGYLVASQPFPTNPPLLRSTSANSPTNSRRPTVAEPH